MKNLWKKILVTGLAVVLGASVIGCGASGNSSSQTPAQVTETEKTSENAQDEPSGELKPIRIGAVGQSNTLGAAIGIAYEKGILTEELEKVGYTPEVIGFAQAGPAINEAFAAKNIDVAVYGDLPATVAKSNGTDTTIFATYGSQMQMGVFVRDGIEDIQSVKDFPGHKIIVARGTIYHQYFNSIIEDAGVSEDDIEQINTFSDATSLIASGDADVLITSTSIAYYLESLGYGKLIEDSTGHPEWTSQFFAVGLTDYLAENREAAKAIVKAMIRGQEFIIANPNETYEIWAETSNYTADIYEKDHAYDTSFSYYSPELTEESVEKLKKLNDFLLDQGLIVTSVDAENFVDKSIYEEAKAEYDSEK